MTCPQIKCWEHYQGFYARIMSRDISLAVGYLKIRVAALRSVPTIEDLFKVTEAGHLAINLVNAQWRQMVREPFDFRSDEQVGKALLSRLGLVKKIERRM